jgi:hypothetical protein
MQKEAGEMMLAQLAHSIVARDARTDITVGRDIGIPGAPKPATTPAPVNLNGPANTTPPAGQ